MMDLEGTREKILLDLKTRGPRTAAALAERLGLTAMGVRQHLKKLDEQGLVTFENERRPKGRPAQIWRLTEKAASRFPEGYADLAMEILEGVRQRFGVEALDELVLARTEKQVARYRSQLPPDDAPLMRRVKALVQLRTREGYMAECRKNQDGTITLIENNCPICVAA
ncbi:MAG: helix-turn-helix domain-containing protein, partial [Gammaproteobacteria bacterium]|nr:helix-turn-helix domain-containing protein [Gammaproteobacteria bacterium]